MRNLWQVLNRPLTNKKADVLVSRWSVGLTGPAVLALAAWSVARHAANAWEISLGLGLGVLTCLLLIWFGVTNGRLAALEHASLPRRARLLLYGCYALVPLIFGAGGWQLSRLPLNRVGFLCGFLVLLSLVLGNLCLGTFFALRQRPAKAP